MSGGEEFQRGLVEEPRVAIDGLRPVVDLSPIGPMIGMRPLGNRSNTVSHSERSGITGC